jgi:uncharacterized membrane protein (DUF373 family)
MKPSEDKFSKAILATNKFVVKFLICVLTICLILSSLHLVDVVYEKIKEPPFLLIDINTLFDVFSLVLIITIGYELVKSLLIIISSEAIPSFPLTQIAIIAVTNKIITLDIKHTEPITLFGLAALVLGLGACYFLHRKTLHKDDAIE